MFWPMRSQSRTEVAAVLDQGGRRTPCRGWLVVDRLAVSLEVEGAGYRRSEELAVSRAELATALARPGTAEVGGCVRIVNAPERPVRIETPAGSVELSGENVDALVELTRALPRAA